MINYSGAYKNLAINRKKGVKMDFIERDTLIFYKNHYETILKLPADKQLLIFKAVFDYAFYGNITEFTESDFACGIIFDLIKPQIDANNRKYLNGKLGGRPKNNQNETKTKPNRNQKITKSKPKNNQTETKTKPNDNVNDNVNVNINNNISSISCIKEKKEKELEKEKKEEQLDIVELCEQKKCEQKLGIVENIQKKDLLNPDRTKITTSDTNSVILNDIKNWWNNFGEVVAGLDPIIHIMGLRKDELLARIMDCGGVDNFKKQVEQGLMQLVNDNNEFFFGKNQRHWKINIDWIIREKNFARFVEGTLPKDISPRKMY